MNLKSSNKNFSNRGTDGRTNGHFEDLAQLKLRTGPDQIRQTEIYLPRLQNQTGR